MFDPKFFLGIVTDNNDPDKRGRVRVRVMGIHTELTTPNDEVGLGIEEKDLPLAQCMYPVTYTGTKGTCPPPSLLPGDWVIGVSLDGNSYQNLLILGLAKAKFNAESLADGSINAEDAFAGKNDKQDGLAKIDSLKDKAQEVLKGKSASEVASTLASKAGKSDTYEKAKEVFSEYASGNTANTQITAQNNTPINTNETNTSSSATDTSTTVNTASGSTLSQILDNAAKFTNSSSYGLATGTQSSAPSTPSSVSVSPAVYTQKSVNDYVSAGGYNTSFSKYTNSLNTLGGLINLGTTVYNTVKYLKNVKQDNDTYKRFTDTSNLEIDTYTNTDPNDIVTETLGEGYYNYCYDYFNKKTNKKSDILPMFAYYIGVGETEDYLDWYGDPRTNQISYIRFIQNMKNDGLINEADYMLTIIKKLNEDKSNKVEISDKILNDVSFHQYRLTDEIIDKRLCDLGTVVIPSLRSTISSVYATLPEYSEEGDIQHEHFGIDFMTDDNVPVVSFAKGTVLKIYSGEENGNAVIIEHPVNMKTLYMHMNSVLVKEKQVLSAGETIGLAGNCGTGYTHLHFGMKYDTKLVDPYKFLTKNFGFFVRKINNADMYIKKDLSSDSDAYKAIESRRTDKNISWSF